MPVPIPAPDMPGAGLQPQPYYVRDRQPWAVEQERQRHTQALWAVGGCRLRSMRPCSVEECKNPHKRNGYCHMHSERLRRNGTLEPKRGWRPGDTPCAHLGCGGVTLGGAHGFCRKHGARYRKHGSSFVVMTRYGPLNEGGGFLNEGGYRVICRDGRHIMEHRWVMEQEIGRPLLADETVHHRNGIRDDNRIANLELWASMHPSGQRVEDLLAFAQEVLDRYAGSYSRSG